MYTLYIQRWQLKRLRKVHDKFCSFRHFHFTADKYSVYNSNVYRFHRFSTWNVGIVESEL